MYLITPEQAELIGGGHIAAAAVVIAVGVFVWTNREELNDMAQAAASTLADLDAECGD